MAGPHEENEDTTRQKKCRKTKKMMEYNLRIFRVRNWRARARRELGGL